MSFEKLLRPDSIAVIGASADKNKVGYSVVDNLVNGKYQGRIYPINPHASEILGLKCYRSILDITDTVDCAVVVVKKEMVIQVLQDCSEKKVKSVIIITAGFAETGEDGRRLQHEIARLVSQKQMTMMGPNCLGMINPWHKMNASFGQALGEPGSIALFSQSGALITAIQDMAATYHIGFSMLASLGNKATLDEVELLQNLQNDEHTRVIAAYLEDIGRGQEFMRVAEKVSKIKPVVILKSGRTASGARAASSHTGSLAGSDSAYNCAFERTGIIRAGSIEQLFDISIALAYQPLPKGDRVAVVTNAGGPGIMMTDTLEMEGLTMAKLDAHTVEQLKKVLPPAGSVNNPIDVLGDASGELYGKAIEILLSSNSVDALIVILTPQKMTDDVTTAKAIIDISKKYQKPVFACFMGTDIIAKGVELLRGNKIPQYSIPERAAHALHEMVLYSRYIKRPFRVVERFAVNRVPAIKIIRAVQSRGEFEIGEIEAKTIMEAYGFNVPPGALATTPEEASRIADETGYPIAMKIASPDILHKSDIGGVKIGLSSAAAVQDAFELMMLKIKRKKPDAELKGVLIEKMILSGREVILGMKKDHQFGPMLMFGLGGIIVEVLKDVVFGLAPITAEECLKMMQSTKSYRMLTGVRGEKGVDIPSIVVNLQRLSQLVIDFPQIDEVDINPLKVGLEGEGAFVVDARIILSKENG